MAGLRSSGTEDSFDFHSLNWAFVDNRVIAAILQFSPHGKSSYPILSSTISSEMYSRIQARAREDMTE